MSRFLVTLVDMHSYEVFRHVVEPHGYKAIADAMKVSKQRLYQWSTPPLTKTGNENKSGDLNPLDRVRDLIRATKEILVAEWVCTHSGGYFVPNQATEYDSKILMIASDKMIKEFADMISLISTSIVDGQITPAEAESLRHRWQKMQSVMEAYIRACEAGTFRPAETSRHEMSPARVGRAGSKQRR